MSCMFVTTEKYNCLCNLGDFEFGQIPIDVEGGNPPPTVSLVCIEEADILPSFTVLS